MGSPEEIGIASAATPDDVAERNHLLAAMRCASVRLQLAKLDLDSIGTALKGGLITVEEAFDWLAEIGALPLIDAVIRRGIAPGEAAK